MYLKALGIHVYFATIKNSYCLNDKNLEANAKALHALKSTLNDEYLSRIFSIELALQFETLSSLLVNKRHMTTRVTRIKEVILLTCATWFKGVIQGDDPLEINSDFELDEDMPYDELFCFEKCFLKNMIY